MEGRQMAKTGRGTTARRNRNTVRNSREMYVQGNAVKRYRKFLAELICPMYRKGVGWPGREIRNPQFR